MSFRQRGWVAVVAMSGWFAAAQAETPAVVGKKAPLPVIEEIQRRRAEFESPTAGSSFADNDGADSSAFAEALQRVASERSDNAPVMPARISNTVPLPEVRGRFAAALREAARVLEETAADLEDVAAYNEADELRNRAAKLRFDAREALSNVEISPTK